MNIQCDCGVWFNKVNNSQKMCPECKALIDLDKRRERDRIKCNCRPYKYHHPQIEVIDPCVGNPYYITRNQLNEYKPIFRELGIVWREVG